MSDRVCVGAIAGAFGVRGEVRLKSFTSEPNDLVTYSPLWTEDGARSFAVRLTRPVTGGLGVRLSGVETREDAEALKGVTLWADRDKLPSLPDDEFYHADLIGLEVFNRQGESMGVVRDLMPTGPHSVLVLAYTDTVDGQARDAERMIPFVAAYVDGVDQAARRITVDWQTDY